MQPKLFTSALLLAAIGCAQAQTSTVFKDQYKLIKAPNAIASVGADLFGEKVNLYSGSLEFIQNDVSLPGNSSLPVMIGRRLAVGQFAFNDRAFGRWSLEIPHLHGVFARPYGNLQQGWTGRDGTQQRCTKFGAPAEAKGLQGSSLWSAEEYWHGNFLYVPGQGDQQMLRRDPNYTRTPAPMVLEDNVRVDKFPIVTSSHWAIGCIPTLKNSASGEGFLVVSPDGTRYRFDWLVSYEATTLTKKLPGPAYSVTSPSLEASALVSRPVDEGIDTPNIVSSPTLNRQEVWILPTSITDRFGNSVTFTYDPYKPKNLTRIASNDGRAIDITYVQGGRGWPNQLIQAVKDGTRTWTYNYENLPTGINLVSVTLPDQTTWQLAEADKLLADLQYPNEPTYCTEDIIPHGIVLKATLTHPTGAVGTFTLTPTRHGRSGVPYACIDRVIRPPIYYFTNSLTSKTITGPGLAPMTWTYEWDPAVGSFEDCTDCPGEQGMTITDPEGHVSRHFFGNRYFYNEGKLLRTDEGVDGDVVLRRTQIFYNDPSESNLYPMQVGQADELLGTGSSDVRLMPQKSRTITQQGVNFNWIADSYDDLARPVQVTKTTGLGLARTEITSYFDNDPAWVMGQIQQVSSGGQVMVRNEYGKTFLLEKVSHFGIEQKRMTYHTNGALASLTQGKQTTRFYDYVRGVAQLVIYDGTSITESSQINNLGNPDWTRDAAGFVTNYYYDAMGRLSSVKYPTGGTTAWNDTKISFSRSALPKYDLPAGHWKYEVSTGKGYVANYYDALWRPVYSEQWDGDNIAGTRRITKRRFDSKGQTTYQSYPKRNHSEIGDGVHHLFDALGRETLTSTNSELGMLYSGTGYLDGFVKVKTNNRGKSTFYSFQAFDQPSEDAIVSISAPEGVSVSIDRDLFGKPLSITRSGGGKSATRFYVYDPGARLCKTIEPETGATIQQYDTFNNLEWKASGLLGSTYASTSSCDQGAVAEGSKTRFTYDVRNQLLSTEYGDKSPKVTRTYTNDGLPETVVSDGATWTYTYNNRRLNELERLSYGGKLYDIGRAYDANGSLKSITYPVDNLAVDYAPNALGEPTRAGTFATNVTYHPNGAIARFTYGNGIAHTMEQNVRGLPKRSVDAGVLDDTYSYDPNANVASIIDGIAGSVTTRTMGYDDLDRLLTVSAPNLWGKATYTYDALDNLTSSSISGGATRRTSTHNFDQATNLLKSVTSDVSAYALAYVHDSRGNITKRGNQEFVFDLANRMRSAKYKGTYTYDGHGRRVSVIGTDGANRVQVYGSDGKLRYAGITGITGTKYIYLGNHLIAESRPGFTQYDHTDGLGSPVALTNSSRNIVSRTRYEPYGATASGDTPAIGFSGHVNAADIGLVYMQQRYYDPISGRFLSIDPVVTDIDTSEGFNRYNYANNSPYKYIDPDGRLPILIPVVVFVGKEIAGEVFEQATGIPAPTVKNAGKAAIKAAAKTFAKDTAKPRRSTKFKNEVWAGNKEKNDGVAKCEQCGKEVKPGEKLEKGDKVPPNRGDAHHVKELAKGGADDAKSNGKLLCNPCHVDVHKAN